MRFSIVRGVAVFVIFALAACGGRAIVPTQSSAPGMPFTGDLAPRVTNPCATLGSEGVWHFHGSCLSANVKQSATLFKLKAYRGITQILKYPAVSGKAPSKTPLITGEATGHGDITGTFQGTKFPVYGSSSVPCVNQYGSAASCSGKAVLYDLMVNPGTTTVNFVGSPSVALTAGSVLKKKKTCTLNQMVQDGGWAYEPTPVTAAVKKGKVVLPTDGLPYHMDSHTVEVFAISCQ